MIYPERTISLRDGRTLTVRSADPKDSEILLKYMNATAEETPYLLREPGEFSMTVEQEAAFIRSNMENPRFLMLLAFLDGEHVGNCTFYPVGSQLRLQHRCAMAIALYKNYWGLGIGEHLMRISLEQAKEIGYEQVELDAVTENEGAIHLYRKLGFEPYGTLKNALKYQDGTYADTLMMRKSL